MKLARRRHQIWTCQKYWGRSVPLERQGSLDSSYLQRLWVECDVAFIERPPPMHSWAAFAFCSSGPACDPAKSALLLTYLKQKWATDREWRERTSVPQRARYMRCSNVGYPHVVKILSLDPVPTRVLTPKSSAGAAQGESMPSSGRHLHIGARSPLAFLFLYGK